LNLATLERAIALANQLGHIFVATADASGFPHVAAGGTTYAESKDYGFM
jgi:hypothetical protein